MHVQDVETRDPSTMHGIAIIHFCVAQWQGVKVDAAVTGRRKSGYCMYHTTQHTQSSGHHILQYPFLYFD